MYSLNKLIGYLTNPAVLAWIGVLLALVLRIVGRRRLAGALLVLCIAWIWLWATPLMTRMIGVPLEQPYLVDGRVPSIESYPQADVIELHGGSMGYSEKLGDRGQGLGCGYAEMWTSADRVWMAARLWKAGKAPKIVVSGATPASTQGLLMDFGVPTNAMVFAESPRNTEEEAHFIAEAMKGLGRLGGLVGLGGVAGEDSPKPSKPAEPSKLTAAKPRVLVVTSAWHMRRTMMMYAKYAPNVEAIPAPCDFENTFGANEIHGIWAFIPTEAALLGNGIAAHEWIGILGYRFLRK